MAETFVNPYTFVPLPDAAPKRSAPHGHSGRGDLLSGRLTVTITAETPLLVRGITANDEQRPRLPRRPDGTVMIPGSSLKGALRSLHETLAGGCLRVFDNEFVPGYRASANSDEIGTVRLAVVVSHDDEDSPPELELCEEGDTRTHRLHQNELLRLHSEEAPLTSGDRLEVTFDEHTGKPSEATRSDEGDWVVFLSDAGVRDKKYPYRAHIRKLPEVSDRVRVAPEVWQAYRYAIEGADDLRTQRAHDRGADNRYVPVIHTYQPDGEPKTRLTLGRRWAVSKRLRPGQPVWVRVDERDRKTVTAVRQAMIWRRRGEYPASERVGDPALLPCEDPRRLCPSCGLFGSADTSGNDSGHARQHSYAGHVRIGDALALDEIHGREVTLPPMGVPRPGSGQFYLVNDRNTQGNASTQPLREWGSVADRGNQRRRLRGRKYYWHTPLEGSDPPRRGQARTHQLDKSRLISEATLIPQGSRFRVTLTFTDLDEAQLGGLLAALQPRKLLGQRVWQHIGGGRPLGYGSCTLTVDSDNSAVWRSGTRYGATGDAVPLDIDGFLAEFDEWARGQAPAVRRLWPLLGKALSPETVEPDAVWYPPGASWAHRDGDEDDGKKFDEGHDFWKQTSGEELSRDESSGQRRGYPLTPLPDLSATEQSMEIVTDDRAVPLPNQHPHPHEGRKGKRT
ncbi:TIGR03986 family CRISPR-associated RAMP protein [Actinopolyspora sp. H202]|uniref:TIGR03986 family type III CRISPR-associated RAMP protein n=1 Tax=Actinopolyspora sp. H202 TaxID=1500456 RepID=UPI003EE4D00E